jgi:xanthine dehydrogenase accessory factor
MSEPELVQLARMLDERGEAYALATVVRVAPPSSAYVGAQAIVRSDGSLTGWVGGGCARDIVVAAAREAIAAGRPTLVRIANEERQPETGVQQHAMPCASDGTIELFIQPRGAGNALCVLGDTPAAGEARFLAQRLGIRLVADVDTAAIVLIATQGTGDAEALERALASPARRVLMIASSRKAAQLRETMRQRGVPDASLARLESPAGPAAGAKTPAEIALVAVAGVLAALRREEPQAEASVAAAPRTDRAETTFINPVCGTVVSTRTAKHVENYDGENYYFCCDGCWLKFQRDPARYAAMHRAAAPPGAS